MIDQCLEYPCTEAAGGAAVVCIALFFAWTWWDYRRLKREMLGAALDLIGSAARDSADPCGGGALLAQRKNHP